MDEIWEQLQELKKLSLQLLKIDNPTDQFINTAFKKLLVAVELLNDSYQHKYANQEKILRQLEREIGKVLVLYLRPYLRKFFSDSKYNFEEKTKEKLKEDISTIIKLCGNFPGLLEHFKELEDKLLKFLQKNDSKPAAISSPAKTEAQPELSAQSNIANNISTDTGSFEAEKFIKNKSSIKDNQQTSYGAFVRNFSSLGLITQLNSCFDNNKIDISLACNILENAIKIPERKDELVSILNTIEAPSASTKNRQDMTTVLEKVLTCSTNDLSKKDSNAQHPGTRLTAAILNNKAIVKDLSGAAIAYLGGLHSVLAEDIVKTGFWRKLAGRDLSKKFTPADLKNLLFSFHGEDAAETIFKNRIFGTNYVKSFTIDDLLEILTKALATGKQKILEAMAKNTVVISRLEKVDVEKFKQIWGESDSNNKPAKLVEFTLFAIKASSIELLKKLKDQGFLAKLKEAGNKLLANFVESICSKNSKLAKKELGNDASLTYDILNRLETKTATLGQLEAAKILTRATKEIISSRKQVDEAFKKDFEALISNQCIEIKSTIVKTPEINAANQVEGASLSGQKHKEREEQQNQHLHLLHIQFARAKIS